MSDVDTLEDLFEHELAGLYYVETELIDVLDELALESRNDEIKAAFADHREETREHATRLEDVFRAVGESSYTVRSSTLDGLVEDRQRVVEATNDPDLVDSHSVAIGRRIEAVEIEAYESLLRMAEELDYEEDVTEPLEKTLDEEEDAKEKLSAIGKQSRFGKLLAKIR
ncbi:ferritin-like domain-containing protein [Natronoarchaeum mannanilyticum]|uniref:Ferritin-like domain-containing protein n=1 Tax=Natronoarchaeum mannanilyticum TaxID=926360 RepID=A0AAV3TCW0_9EURY